MSYESKLDCRSFEKWLVVKGARLNGVQYIFRFDNNYGASVIKFTGTFGHVSDLWELAVIYFDKDGDYKIAYDTQIAYDVIGWLTDDEVRSYLGRIMKLPNRFTALDSR